MANAGIVGIVVNSATSTRDLFSGAQIATFPRNTTRVQNIEEDD
jgi:hypothetical protein